MMRKIIRIITLTSFFAAVLVIAVLVFVPEYFFRTQDNEIQQTRVIIPRTISIDEISVKEHNPETMAYEDSMMSKVPMREGEYLLAAITQNFDDDPHEEQIIAYRKPTEAEGPVYAAYIDFDEQEASYRRTWDTVSLVTKAGTLNFYTDDLIGDRSLCLVIMGMNSANEQTLTVFRKNSLADSQEIFHKISELNIDGSIVIKKTPRNTAYQIMFSPGDSYSLAAYSQDYDSSNMLDQIETTYSYNPAKGLYEQTKIAKIPGSQIEQRQIRELLNGSAENLESFVFGLWYLVSPDGSLKNNQFIYFDPESREVIFHGEDTYQVFVWQTSTPTRYGMHVGSQNSSVSTLRRTIAIELESLERIRLSVYEDVRLKIGVSTPWNGSYRKADIAEVPAAIVQKTPAVPHLNAAYEGFIGKILFLQNGNYQLMKGENGEKSFQEGKYAFFTMGDTELLELRPRSIPESNRDLYRIERSAETENVSSAEELTLHRVMIGTRGIQELHEAAISLTKTAEESVLAD